MTKVIEEMRSPASGKAMASTGYILHSWLQNQPSPRSAAFAGGIDFRIDDGEIVTFDLAVVSADVNAATGVFDPWVEGLPMLAVTIFSPRATLTETRAAIGDWMTRGVPLVWLLDTDAQSVTVYRTGMRPKLHLENETLTGGDDLPRFECKVAELFE